MRNFIFPATTHYLMMNSFNRFTAHRVFIVCSIVLGAIGLSNIGSAQFSGLVLALGAVFFVLFAIFNLLKGQKTDDEIAADNARRAQQTARELAKGESRRLAA